MALAPKPNVCRLQAGLNGPPLVISCELTPNYLPLVKLDARELVASVIRVVYTTERGFYVIICTAMLLLGTGVTRAARAA